MITNMERAAGLCDRYSVDMGEEFWKVPLLAWSGEMVPGNRDRGRPGRPVGCLGTMCKEMLPLRIPQGPP